MVTHLLLAMIAGAVDQGVNASASSTNAVRIHGSMDFDGLLREAEWARAQKITQFWEIYPADRGKPSEETSASFLYDDRFLYIGLRGDLRDPSQLRQPFVRRDLVNSSQDYIQVYIDPIRSRRQSYLFRVNARGSRADSIQDELRQTEVADPDFDWEVRTAVDERGWSAELRIPLSTLRVPHSGPQDWPIVVYRGVPRQQNVQFASAPIPRVSSCFLCYAGTLHFDDLRIGAENLLVTPSTVVTRQRRRGAFGSGDHIKVDPSLDVKWLPYPGAALDVTINPDFSQTEADAAQLSANNRFAINFPEKRAFFREGTDLITLPIPLLYTRTIVAPNAGLRFTSRSDRFNGTAFLADDDGDGAILEPGFLSSAAASPGQHAFVGFGRARVSINAFDLGGLVAFKRLAGGAQNIITGADGSWGHGPDRVTAQLVDSWTRNPDAPDLLPSWDGQRHSGLSALAQWDHSGSDWVWNLRYARYGEGFRSWLGFVPRVAYDQIYLKLLRPHYPENGILNELSPFVTLERNRGLSSEPSERDVGIGFQAAGPRNTNGSLTLHPATTLATEDGRLRHVGTLAWSLSSNPVSWLPRVSTTGEIGTFVDFQTGDRVQGLTYTIDVITKPLDRLELEVRRVESRLGDRPGGGWRLKETATEIAGSWFFNPRLYLSGILQLFYTKRRYPSAPQLNGISGRLQLSWEASRNLTAYAGLRTNEDRGEVLSSRGKATELYVKLSRTLRTRF
jgi:hypothetical protein